MVRKVVGCGQWKGKALVNPKKLYCALTLDRFNTVFIELHPSSLADMIPLLAFDFRTSLNKINELEWQAFIKRVR